MRTSLLSVWMLLAFSFMAEGQELPTVLTYASNALAWRGYGFTEKQWSGLLARAPSAPFGIATRDKPVKGFYLRDKVFSGLNSKKPMIRSITRYEDGVEDAVEFEGIVVARAANSVFLMWTNDFTNKVWLAAVDLAHRKAVLTQAFRGVTSVGGEIETLDCR